MKTNHKLNHSLRLLKAIECSVVDGDGDDGFLGSAHGIWEVFALKRHLSAKCSGAQVPMNAILRRNKAAWKLLGDDQRIADLHERAAAEQGAGGADCVDLVQLLGVAHHAGHDVVMAGGLDGLVVKG